MCYRCSVCSVVTAPNEKLKRHTIYRPNKQIQKEYPVCNTCSGWLEQYPLSHVSKIRQNELRALPRVIKAVSVIREEAPVKPVKGKTKKQRKTASASGSGVNPQEIKKAPVVPAIVLLGGVIEPSPLNLKKK